MCNICQEKLEFVSFNWKNGMINYIYRCTVCGEKHEFATELDDDVLSNLLSSEEFYNKNNL